MTANNEKLEVHYYFQDEQSHTMDAIVRNRCEHEILLMTNSIAKELGIDVRIETEPKDEGGLIDIYNFFGTVQGAGMVSLAALVVGILQLVIPKKPDKRTLLDKEEQRLRIENLKLEKQLKEQKVLKNEYKLNELQRVDKWFELKDIPNELKPILELVYLELDSEKIFIPELTPQKIQELVTNHYQLSKFKSNLFRQLARYPKVERFSVATIDKDKKIIKKSKEIERNEFQDYVIENDEIEPIIQEDSVIELISPVLKPGKYKWKGVMKNEHQPFEFTMSDKKFKGQILKEGLTFQSGTSLYCTIKINRKSDELGNVYNINYNVIEVMKVQIDGIITETTKGKNRRLKKEIAEQQLRFFNDSELNDN